MSQKMTIRIVLIVGIISLFGYLVYPTIRFNSMNPEEKKRLEIEDERKYQNLLKKSIKLGLDLQGGMNVVLEVDVRELLEKLAKNKDQRFKKALDDAVKASAAGEGGDLVENLDRNISQLGADIALYYGNRELRSRKEILQYLNEQAKESINRTLEILRNRIDEFGVEEPNIQKQGGNRIVIELAGVSNRDRAIALIGKTAKLEFRLLKETAIAQEVVTRINAYLMGEVINKANKDSSEAVDQANEKTAGDPEKKDDKKETVSAKELFGSSNVESDSADSDSSGIAKKKAQEELFVMSPQGIFIKQSSIARFHETLKNTEIQKIIESEAGSAEFLLSKKAPETTRQRSESEFLQVYLLNKNAELTGETITKALRRRGSPDDPTSAGKWEVNLTLNDEGAKDFARVTGANTGKPLAIVLDRRVQSAPTIQGKISGGRARITGLDTADESKDLAIVLKAGALPAPAKIVRERMVGASLGQDSIDKGLLSTVWGLTLVAIFMMIYYKFSGGIANLALILNILILMGFMSSIHATLTLPGIAGIILTIGMAVDANVLIFERIREELDKGKSLWAAIDTGYGRAFITILDANVTTFIAAFVLYNIGSGPIRGFAVTLMIGIGASMFTAIFVTRTLFEFLLSKKIMKQISI